jgi:nucleoside-diphosphate-sugar epimerase
VVFAILYNRCYGIETIGLRYFNVFGPKQNPNGDYAAVIPKFITLLITNMSPKINGDGSASRDFTYVDNVVYANLLALTIDNLKCYGEEFNIGAGGCTSVLDLFYSIRDMLQSSISPTYGPYRSGDILMSNANISKAADLLGYTPSVDLITGLEHTIKYFYEKDNTL